MSISCNLVLQWNATPEQLTNLGTALWSWCMRKVGHTNIYQNLDSQPLADLIAGRLPASRQGGQRGINFHFKDEASDNRLATIHRLRREIPAKGIEDVLVDGTSWNFVEKGVRSPPSDTKG